MVLSKRYLWGEGFLFFFKTSSMSATSTNTSTTSAEKLISACGGALVTSLLVTPMDVIKLRLQTQQATNIKTTLNQCCQLTKATSLLRELPYCSWIKNDNKNTSAYRFSTTKQQIPNLHDCLYNPSRQSLIFKGTLDGLYKIIRYEGVPNLWKGLSPALVMSIPANVIYIVGYDHLRDAIRTYTTINGKDYSPLIAGGVARTIGVVVVSPIELFRTRLQATTSGIKEFQNVLKDLIKMVKQSGPIALWRGLPPTLYRDVPFSAIYWMGYEETKQALLGYNHEMTGLQASFLSGAFSGMIAAGLTTPFDVAKTKRQVGTEYGGMESTRMPVILKQIYQQEGTPGLFRGLTARLAKISISCSIMISSYELGKSLFANQHQTL
ncbi:mitochondrial carrier domain-containing protein [Chlamydoabsidia padenii]|nr:mitochondrial carrier domain-containing protein [Chlamydoabsidia padenii]